MTSVKSEPVKQRCLMGMYFLSFKYDCGIQLLYEQGRVVGECRDYVICDIFSWLSGGYLFSDMRTEEGLAETILFPDLEDLECWLKNNRHNYEKTNI